MARHSVPARKSARDLFSLAIPFAESRGIFFREAGNVGDRLFEIAAQHECRSIVVSLAELIARRDVSDALVQIQILEPGRFADMEMIDRVQIVVEAR
jgi:hypothetical protein